MTITVQQPTLLLDEAICKRNISRMAHKAHSSGVSFRPHFKTHQAATIGAWFREVGVTAITASSLRMAHYFAEAGWEDIVVAFPVNWAEIDLINQLAARITLGLLVDSVATVDFLAQNLTHPVNIWLDVDTGYHRSGVDWADSATFTAIVEAIQNSDLLTTAGLLTHDGHTYKARSNAEISAIYTESSARLIAVRDHLATQGVAGLCLSLGDTPSCSVVDDLSAVDEIRPGNFVFYDTTQVQITACTLQDIAVAVACPVVGKYPARNQIVVYGGGVHLSKESITDTDGNVSFGAVATLDDDGWHILDDANVGSLSQEHGVIYTSAATFERIDIGDTLAILPVHSCMTANLLKGYRTLDGQHIDMAQIF